MDSKDEPLVVLVTGGTNTEDAHEQLKRGWRRAADVAGRCPVCAANVRAANRDERRAMTRRYGADLAKLGSVMEHEAGCPVGDGPPERWAS